VSSDSPRRRKSFLTTGTTERGRSCGCRGRRRFRPLPSSSPTGSGGRGWPASDRGPCGHFHGQHAFGDHLARAHAAMPTPSTCSVCGSRISLVRPSLRPRVVARPEAAHGKDTIFTSRPSCLACCSVSPHQASSGSVKTTPGMARGSNRRLAEDGFHGHAALVRGLVGQHRFAGHIADGEDVRLVVRRCWSTLTKPLRRVGCGCFPGPGSRCWAGGRPRSARDQIPAPAA
jgi:hypothetical protein